MPRGEGEAAGRLSHKTEQKWLWAKETPTIRCVLTHSVKILSGKSPVKLISPGGKISTYGKTPEESAMADRVNYSA